MRLTEHGGVIMPSAKQYGWPTCIFLLATLLWCIPLTARADTKVITAEGAYTMGDGETPLVAELRALQQAKRQAVEQAGTYVQSYTKSKHYDLTEDEIETVSAGIIEVEVLEKKRLLVGDGLRFSVKIKATVTTEKADELVFRLRQKTPDASLNLVREYKRLNDDFVRLATEMDALKRQIAESKGTQEQQPVASLIAEQERKYQARELFGRCQASLSNPSPGFSSTVACLDEVIRLDPRFADAWGMRGRVRETMLQREGSILDYTEAIRLDPDPYWYLLRGQAFLIFNQRDRAIMDANEGIRLDPNDDSLYQFRGFLYYEQGKYREAARDLTEAIRVNSVTKHSDSILATIALAEHYTDRGIVYGLLGQHQESIADFTNALQFLDSPGVQTEYPSYFKRKKSRVFYGRAKTYALLKQDDEALRDYRQACALGDKEACGLLERR